MFPGGKGGRCLWLTTLPPSCADCLEIWEPQPPGTLKALRVCNGIALPFYTKRKKNKTYLRICILLYIYTRVAANIFFFCCGAATQRGSWPPYSWGFLDHTQWRTTVGRTPLDEWSSRRRDLYLTTHNRQTSMPPVGFEPTISAGERPQTYPLDRAATGTGGIIL